MNFILVQKKNASQTSFLRGGQGGVVGVFCHFDNIAEINILVKIGSFVKINIFVKIDNSVKSYF